MLRKMKLICTLLLLVAMIVQGTALAVPNVIRLHVIANSDSPGDQAVKERVRDRIVRDLAPVFAGMDQRSVETWIWTNQGLISTLAAEVLAEEGLDYPVQVKFGVVPYPTRVYGPAVYPAGRYKSLRLVLGAGEGRNWWCLLFPPLCFVEGTTADGEGEAHNPEEVKVRFWLLEKVKAWLQRMGITGNE
jgi:stage II sporulation protein R